MVGLLCLQADLKKWKELDTNANRTLPCLMELLQSEARPEAPQPEVNLPSSAFMLHILAVEWCICCNALYSYRVIAEVSR